MNLKRIQTSTDFIIESIENIEESESVVKDEQMGKDLMVE